MPSLSKGTKSRKRSNATAPSVPKPKQIRKRSTDRHRRATTHVNDRLSADEESALTLNIVNAATPIAPTMPQPVVAAAASNGGGASSSSLMPSSVPLVEDVFSVAATHLDITETFNFSRSKLHNVIKNAHRQHKRVAQQIRQSVEARAPVLNQCRQALSELDDARNAVDQQKSANRSATVRLALKALTDVDRAIRTELQALATIEDAITKQNDAIAALHAHQVRAYSDARDALVQVCEDPTFVYRIKPGAGADDKKRHRTHSEGAAAICREITRNPLVLFGTTELQRKHFTS
jgi:hypothetical protein